MRIPIWRRTVPAIPFPMTETRAPTIGERIVVHLSQYLRIQDEYVVPPAMAQTGIAETLGLSRAHVAIELRRQMEAGRIEVRVAHVTGAPTRRKVYRLTPKGVHIAESVRSRALGRTVELVLPGGRIDAFPGPRALEILRRFGVAEGRAILMLLLHRRIDVRFVGLQRQPRRRPTVRSAEAQARAAFVRAYVRPFAWQLAVVQGPPNAPPVPVAA